MAQKTVFGYGCSLEEHVQFGRCLDGLCGRRAAWERAAAAEEQAETVEKERVEDAVEKREEDLEEDETFWSPEERKSRRRRIRDVTSIDFDPSAGDEDAASELSVEANPPSPRVDGDHGVVADEGLEEEEKSLSRPVVDGWPVSRLNVGDAAPLMCFPLLCEYCKARIPLMGRVDRVRAHNLRASAMLGREAPKGSGEVGEVSLKLSGGGGGGKKVRTKEMDALKGLVGDLPFSMRSAPNAVLSRLDTLSKTRKVRRKEASLARHEWGWDEGGGIAFVSQKEKKKREKKIEEEEDRNPLYVGGLGYFCSWFCLRNWANERASSTGPKASGGGLSVKPLLEASRRGDLESVHRLLSSGVFAGARDDSGRTPLLEAVVGMAEVGKGARGSKAPRHLAVLERLLEGGIDARRLLGWMMAERASIQSRGAIKNKAKIFNLRPPVNPREPESRRTPIFLAAQFGFPNAIAILLRAGARPDLRDVWGRGAPEIAADPKCYALVTGPRDATDTHKADATHKHSKYKEL